MAETTHHKLASAVPLGTTDASAGLRRHWTAAVSAAAVFVVLGYLAFGVGWPLWKIVETAVRNVHGTWTTQFIRETVLTAGLAQAAIHSIAISGCVTLLATALGTVLAWLVARTDVPGRRVVRWALVAPFAIPPFIGALAWLQLLGPQGWVNQAVRSVSGGAVNGWDIRGFLGIVFVLVLTSYPLAYVTVSGALARFDPSLEEATRICGAGIGRTLRNVTMPVLRPAIASGAVLIFVFSMADFGVPAVLGFSKNFYVLTTRIYDLIANASHEGSLNQAAALSLLLGIVVIAALLIQRWGGRSTQPRNQRGGASAPLTLGHARPLAGVFAWATVAVALAAPLVAIALTSVTKALGNAPTGDNLTLSNYRRAVLEDPTTLRAARNSLILAFAAAAIVTLLGVLIGYLVQRTRVPGRHVLDAVGSLPYALPGTVVAVGVLLAFIRPIGPIALFNTLWIILLAYVVHYLAYGIRATSGALAVLDVSLEEASRICGASRAGTVARIVLPMLRTALMGAFILVFVPTVRELTLSVLLWGPGTETIGVTIFSLQSAGDTQAAAAISMLVIVAIGLLNALARGLSRGRVGF